MRGMIRVAAMLALAVAASGMTGCAIRTANGAGEGVALRREGTGEVGRKLFDEGWLFEKGDVTGGGAVGLEDGGWRQVELPHDWSIEGPFDKKWAACTGFLPAGIGWYRKHFRVAGLKADEMVRVVFEGVYKHATVYLNGHEVGGRAYGYSTFACDLTPWLRKDGGENVLAVRVDHHDFADSRWYPGSGIYRDVYLERTNRVHVGDVFVTTPAVTRERATVGVVVRVDDGVSAMSVPHVGTVAVRTRIFDARGEQVAEARTPGVRIHSGENAVAQQLVVERPALWSMETPTMYTAVTEVSEGGKVVDTYRTDFGIRTINFDAKTGFWLNGENVKIKGVCLHEDAGALGSAIPRQVWERRLRILKEAGVNGIRTSHNPPAPEFLDLCDRLGFVVMDEAFDEWTKGKKKWLDRYNGKTFTTDGYHSDFEEWADRDIQEMVRRDRNHPSVVMWSIGNEIDYQNDPYPPNDPELPAIASRLIRDVKALDRTRPVTAACASIGTNLFCPQLDIVGYNYQEQRYAEDHAEHPLRVIYGSENSQTGAAWKAVEGNAFIFGQFLWTGIDYLGEAGAWPRHGSGAGMLDTAGFPKERYWLRKELWTSAPLVKIVETPRGMVCFTNCEKVVFSQGGKKIGERVPSKEWGAVRVPAGKAGEGIHAEGMRGGKVVAGERYVAGVKPTRIEMKEYKTTLGPGDGPNVAQVEVALVDDAGVRGTRARQEVAFSVEGPGRILGIDTGDQMSTEDPHGTKRKAFHGRMIVYVETRGVVKVKAQAAGMREGEVVVGRE